MPFSEKLFGAAGTTTLTDFIVPASGERHSVSFLRAANTHASAEATVDVAVVHPGGTHYIGRNVKVPAGEARDIISEGEKFFLPSSASKIQVRASANANIDFVATSKVQS